MSRVYGEGMDEIFESDEWRDVAILREILIGQRIVKAEGDVLTLSSGSTLTVEGNRGCGGCTSGRYEIDYIKSHDNIITDVRVSDDGTHVVALYVYAEGIPGGTPIISASGDVGNGYYGTGFTIGLSTPNSPNRTAPTTPTEQENS